MIRLRGDGLRAPTFASAREYQNAEGVFWGPLYRGVAQLVARTAGGREVAGSSPVIPTIEFIISNYDK